MSLEMSKIAAFRAGWRLKIAPKGVPSPLKAEARQNPPARVETNLVREGGLRGPQAPRRGGAPALRGFNRQPAAKPERPYLYELDRLRIITAVSVVAVHMLAFTMYLDPSSLALVAHMGVLMAFHFTREVFMFVTAFALVYVYYGRPFLWGRFWKRRGIGVVLPYVIWTGVYVWSNFHTTGPVDFFETTFRHLLTGDASYQLYYILLTIQFYVLFPLFLVVLKRVAHRPWLTLGVSFVIELMLLAFLYHGLPRLPLPGGMSSWLGTFTDRFVLDYQFYFFLGGIAALYVQQVRAFLLRYSGWVIGAMAAALAALAAYYLASTEVLHVDIGTAVVVLQPIMVPYSLAVIAFLYWLAYSRVAKMQPQEHTRSQRIWHTLSDSSFGLYLVHPLFLAAILALIISHLLMLPSVVLLVLTWTLTVGGSLAFTITALHVPYFSRLVGREGTQRSKKPAPAKPASAPLPEITEQPLTPEPVTEGSKG